MTRTAATIEDCANPLFVQWLQEWMEKAQQTGNKSYYSLRKALMSMKKYPLPLSNGLEAIKLEGIGKNTAEKLQKKLCQHYESLGITPPDILMNEIRVAKENSLSGLKNTCTNSELNGTEKLLKNQPAKTRPYVPLFRSGAYAILIAMHLLPKEPLSKSRIISVAQQYCNSSFTHSEANKTYTAWSSIKTLLGKEMVLEEGNPKKYYLTEEGSELAEKLYLASEEEPSNATGCGKKSGNKLESISADLLMDIHSQNNLDNQESGLSFSASEKLSQQNNSSVFEAGSFDIVLVIDNREVIQKSDRSYIQRELEKKGIQCLTRSLDLGDFLWVAKRRIAKVECEVNEVVIDYIAERKRLDDLISSIKDGRFQEQKFRLHNCGLQHVIYIVEDFEAATVSIFGLDRLFSVFSAIQVADGFFLKKTNNIDDTINYLAGMTKAIESKLQNISLRVIPPNKISLENIKSIREEQINKNESAFLSFEDFNLLNSKSKGLRICDTYMKMLMAVKGISAEKASMIVTRFPTPMSLLEGYSNCKNDLERKELLMTDPSVVGSKSIGKAISERIYQTWWASKSPI